jgi:hypothetical protein
LVEWTRPTSPAIGDGLVLQSGLYRLTEPHNSNIPELYDGEFKVKRVRDATPEEEAEIAGLAAAGELPIVRRPA